MAHRIRLTEDWIIPAGTEFECIDGEKREFINGNYEAMMPIGADNTMHIIIGEDGLKGQPFVFDGENP